MNIYHQIGKLLLSFWPYLTVIIVEIHVQYYEQSLLLAIANVEEEDIRSEYLFEQIQLLIDFSIDYLVEDAPVLE